MGRNHVSGAIHQTQPEQDRFGNDYGSGSPDPQVHTKLVDKHHSPAIIRKYTTLGWPIYIALICDSDLSDLDELVVEYLRAAKAIGQWSENIQRIRNMAGDLSERLVDHYGNVEGVAVLFYVDKMWVSSLYGDFMSHYACKMEMLQLLNMMAHI